MTTIAIIGGTGYAGGAIRDEALKRGHFVIAVSRSGPATGSAPQGTGGQGTAGPGELSFERGNVHDPAFVQSSRRRPT